MEAGKLTHSHSQPGGMDRTPPGTPKKAGKMLAIRVQMLDDTITMFQVQAKALGRVLFDQVCNQLHLLESDYFGLEYQELGGTKYWLDLEKPLSRQIGLSLVDTLVRFCVKFYTPDPSQLEEEFTRYLFCLQIKRDLSQGLLQCNSNTAALMASYIVQAECGDYVVEDYPDHRYLSSYKFVPNQDQELERKIMENHKKHTGQSPAEADLNLLETARRCELYGIKMHPAKDHEGAPLNLAVAHMGIVVFQNFTKINTFSWAKIRKISFKRKKFLVKLHPEGYGHYKDTVEFFFEGRNECKNFWKKCVENHGFFRCSMVKKVPRQKTRVLSRGSSFRYSGRTQKQIVDFVRENYVKRQTFQRSQSFRHSSSAHSSVANVGTSISAHPLLPLGDNAVAGTPASLSCGSMTLTSSPLHTADIHAGGSPSPPLTTSVSPGTSVTSSPQHFYPQEIPYRRAGHQLTKVKHHQVRSHHAISPLQSPTSAATAASNLSANLSNNNSNNKLDIHSSDTRNSQISLKSLDYANINDVYSNFYSSLRSLRNNIDNNDFVENETKTEICSLANRCSNAVSKSNESIRYSSKKSKPPFYNKTQEFDKCAWYRSASCKDLCHDENVSEVNKNEENSREYSTKQVRTYRERDYNVEFDSPVTLYDNSRRKCYSAATSKNPSVDRGDDVITNFKIYSRSYPGTTSSLSIESPEGESYNRIIEMMNIKCNSQEEMLLSQDDLSHDSYELLERELYDFDSNGPKDNSMGLHSERNRSKSCSWESEGTTKSLSSRSTENILNPDHVRSRENDFWSLEGERSPKHKSEIDFRSLDRKFPKETKSKIENKEGRWADGKYGSSGRRKKNRGSLDCDFKSTSQTIKRSDNIEDEVFKKTTMTREFGNEITCSTLYREKDLYKDIGHESGSYLRSMELEYGNDDEVKNEHYEDERKSEEDFLSCKMNLTEEYFKGKQLWIEERKKMERKREKRDIEERFHEGIREKEQKEWEKGKERRVIERRKNNEEKQRRNGDETTCKMFRRSSDQANFQEAHFIKFDRVVSNQFGKYSEFLGQKNSSDSFLPEKKFLESEEVMCHSGVLPEEQEKKDRIYDFETQSQDLMSKKIQKDVRKTFGEEKINIIQQPMEVICFQEYGEYKNNGLTNISAMLPKNGKVLVERTRSDPYNCVKNLKRNVLTHQKSIDLTPQQSEETHSDYDNDDGLKKTSRSEHDIPYILHKRHCMNGTAKNSDLVLPREDDKCAIEPKIVEKVSRNEIQKISAGGGTVNEGQLKQLSSKTQKFLGQKVSSSKLINGKKPGVQIINLDVKNNKNSVNIIEPHKNIKGAKKSLVKKFIFSESKEPCLKAASDVRNKGMDQSKTARSTIDNGKKELVEFEKSTITGESTVEENEIAQEPIYAEVCKDTVGECEVMDEASIIVPHPPKRTSSVSQKQISDEKQPKTVIKTENERQHKLEGEEISAKASPPTVKSTQKSTCNKSSINEPLMADGSQSSNDIMETKRNKENDRKVTEETVKAQSSSSKGKHDLPLINSVLQRRKDSLTLFARTRLGLSEGSAFIPIVRQSHVDSPVSQRRTKSLDAPYVSVHHLPPTDSFSSKDDTIDNNEGDIIHSAVTRGQGSCKAALKKFSPGKTLTTEKTCHKTVSGKSGMVSVFSQEVEIGAACKEKLKDPLKLEIPFFEGKLMSGVHCTRLLSKIGSLEAFDSEGDMDSSKLADPPDIPSDRLVNLPESVRFPSVRQISGQTSEESADGWDQKEVKVKCRTPRRSVGREEPDVGTMESVVWDSKDDEPPDDNVWDDTLVFTGKYEGSAMTDAVIPADYLKRGSCGQSIDDDNLSTPMKESSPEHWVSVDDLPEALEREEKLLRQKESILREKILNEKLKRELNLDTVGGDGNYHYGFKEGLRQMCGEESTTVKEKFKGHSLDTYELIEKKLRERRTIKNSSLDEHLLGDLSGHNHATSFPISTSHNVGNKYSYENTLKAYQKGIDYVQCRIVSDPTEIDQFGDNDEELEEFFVVLEENLGIEKIDKSVIWNGAVDTFRGTLTNEESLISVPEEFKDAEVEESEVISEHGGLEDMDKCENKEVFKSRNEERQQLFYSNKETSKEARAMRELRFSCDEDLRSPDEHKIHQFSTEPERHSHTDIPSGKSEESRILSTSEDAECLSPFKDSGRESENRRRLSTSEDSRKYSVSESISEGTRRRLSSTEETRRKRASLTKQCSVGEESLSDDLISGVQERSSSLDHDEKDVFESETTNVMMAEEGFKSYNVEIGKVRIPHSNEGFKNKIKFQGEELTKRHLLEIETPEIETSARPLDANDFTMLQPNLAGCETSVKEITHLEPPSNEREFSKETEDSVDYDEADFKDIREVVKEKDISDGLPCDNNSMKSEFEKSKLPSSFDKSVSSEGEELRFIDEKRGSTPEMIVGKSREAMIASMVLVNEGVTIVKIEDKPQLLKNSNNTKSEAHQLIGDGLEKQTLPKRTSKPKPLTPKPLNYIHRKLTTTTYLPTLNVTTCTPLDEKPCSEVMKIKNSLDSSQESDIDKLNDFSLISHVQSQIARRNLMDAGKRLKCEAVGIVEKQSFRQSNASECSTLFDIEDTSEECKRIESGLKSYSDESGFREDSKKKLVKEEKKINFSPSFEVDKENKNGTGKEKSPDQEKRDSGEDGSSSSSAPPHSRRELSSTWKPFLLESSGSSSLEEGWLPPDDNAHLADEEETSSTSNNQQDESYRDEMDCSTGIGYPALNVTSAEMMVSGYGGAFALSRTLSRISERSTSEQERSELEDDLTKLSSHSVSVEEESMVSSDHQPSLSSDPPSPRESTCRVPDLPQDRPCHELGVFSGNKKEAYEPFGDEIPPPIHDEDWPSPPSSSDVFDPSAQSHVETFYMEIYPEEACKVVVMESRKEESSSSSDENRTLHDECELLHISSDNVSVSTTTTTQDGTVIAPVIPRSVRTGSLSEDTSVMSTSDWSSSPATKPPNNSKFGTTEDLSDWTKSSTLQESGGKVQSKHSNDDVFECLPSGSRRENQSGLSISGEIVGRQPDRQIVTRGIDTPQVGTFSDRSGSSSSMHYSEGYLVYETPISKMSSKKRVSKLQKEISPTGKTFGFFETPVSKVRSPTSQSKFFEGGNKMAGGRPSLRSPTSHSEIVSKNYFYDSSRYQVSRTVEAYDLRSTVSPTKKNFDSRKESKTHHHCTPYYSNVADFAEKSYFGRYDTGSLERSKVQLSRKCCSYYSMSKTVLSDEDSSNSEGIPKLSSNTIPRASKKKRRRHRVAMDLEIRDGKIVAPPKTSTTVVENSDSDGSSPRAYKPKGIRKKQSEV